MTPGHRTLSSGSADALEERPLVGVARVGRLEEHGPGLGLPDEVDDVGQVDVVMVRARVVAPAQVHAQLLGRDVAHGVVERLDVQRDAAAERGQVHRRRTRSAVPWPGPGSRPARSRRRRRSPRTPPASPRRWRRGTPRRSGSAGWRRRARPHRATPRSRSCRPTPGSAGDGARSGSAGRRPRTRRPAAPRSSAVQAGALPLAAPGVGGDEVGAARVVDEVGEEVVLDRLAAEAVSSRSCT